MRKWYDPQDTGVKDHASTVSTDSSTRVVWFTQCRLEPTHKTTTWQTAKNTVKGPCFQETVTTKLQPTFDQDVYLVPHLKKESLTQLKTCILPLRVRSVLILLPELTGYNESNLGRVQLTPSNFQIGNALIFSQRLEVSITNWTTLKCLPLLWDTIGLTASKVTHLRDEAAHFYNVLARTLPWTAHTDTAVWDCTWGVGGKWWQLGPEDPVPAFSKCSPPPASEDNIPKWFGRPQEKLFFFSTGQWLLRQ